MEQEINLNAPDEEHIELYNLMSTFDCQNLIYDNIINFIQQQNQQTNNILGFLQHQNSTLFLIPRAKEILISLLFNYLSEIKYPINIYGYSKK